MKLVAPPTISKFLKCDDFYRFLMGPVGSGKSSGCCAEIMRRAVEQKPQADKVRRSRFAIVRNTYGQLADTTLKTWQDWFRPEAFGEINKGEMAHTIKRHLPDKTQLELEVLFRALDKPKDIKKLLSLELTGAWVNEAREVPKGIIDGLGDRVGRYPALKDGGCTWRGVMGDTNMPDDDHWLYNLAEVERPKGWSFFKQPGGLIEIGGEFVENPKAENIDNLEPHYYLTRMAGKSPDYIRVYYCSQYGFVKEGKTVFPEYVDAIHCLKENFYPKKEFGPIWIGLDFGLTPAAVFAQQLTFGRWVWFDELVTEDMGAVRFGEVLKNKMAQDYAGFEFRIFGDPAGNARADTDESTPFQILNTMGIRAEKAPTNDFMLRRDSVAVPLSRLVDGKPGLTISPKCAITRKGMAGGYHYRRIQVSGDERYHDKPVKNKYSHPCEAGGYIMVSAGEGDKLIGAGKTEISHAQLLGDLRTISPWT